jgi:hypothetical protein
LLRETLLADDGICHQLFERRALELMVEDHRAGRRDLTRHLFALLSLGLWQRAFPGAALDVRAVSQDAVEVS